MISIKTKIMLIQIYQIVSKIDCIFIYAQIYKIYYSYNKLRQKLFS